MKILLASQSLSRKKLLSQAGLQFEIFAPCLDEEAFLQKSRLSPKKICLALARLKGEKAQSRYPNHAVIAADQLAFLGRSAFGKARTEKKAINTLSALQGKTHHLIHGLYMRKGKEVFSHATVNKMTMRPLSRSQIENYVQKDRPLKSAGAYLLERAGIGLFENIKTDDFSSIIGLPLTVVLTRLIQWGLKWPV